ncbi:hypothetical protein [Ensifer aridi]|uniref:hypothetical protein n=1 Tax=Ensifer aridi TaxID=1708715 RepID=UPI000A1155A7|nr:hypothetical protein [Ensifer aridi]
MLPSKYRGLSTVALLLLTQLSADGVFAFDLREEVGNCFSGGCDVAWKLNRRVDQGIRSKAESLVGPVKEAFIEATNVLFDEKIGPLIDKVDRISKARLQEVDALVKETEAGILNVIETAAAEAQNTTHQTVQEIRKDIIDNTFAQVNQTIDLINTKAADLIRNIDCRINGSVAEYQEWIQNTLVFVPKPFNDCYTKRGFVFTTPSGTDYFNHYLINQCMIEKELDESTTVEEIKNQYARLSILARRFSCIVRDAGPAEAEIYDDADRYSQSYALWVLATK